jgi:hypothetical protein
MAAELITEEEDLLSVEYEELVENKLVGKFLTAIAKIVKAINRVPEEDELKPVINSLVRELAFKLPSKPVMQKLIRVGVQLGIDNAGLDEGMEIPAIPASVIAELLAPIQDYEDVMVEHIEKVAALIEELDDDSEDLAIDAIALIKTLDTKAKRLAASASGNAQAEGVIQAAKANNLKLIWVNELNACLHCLAYAGRVIDTGNEFGEHSFAAKAPKFNDLKLEHPDGVILGPPLHPHCRCRLRVWDGPEPREPGSFDAGSTTFAEALQREARRAVLRGASNYDSLPARIEAAEKLLDAGANLPVSVERRAKRAIDAGQFKR